MFNRLGLVGLRVKGGFGSSGLKDLGSRLIGLGYHLEFHASFLGFDLATLLG
jgi:hypothetical protein